MRVETYDITGRHCAACSASVERVTRRLPGVERSEVNLTTGILTISYDETQVGEAQIVAKVEKAGFGASLHVERKEEPAQAASEETELRRRKTELITAAGFSAVLLYVSMGRCSPSAFPLSPCRICSPCTPTP